MLLELHGQDPRREPVASGARHKRYDMSEVFAPFDADGDSKLDIYELARAFRAMGLPKRDGSKMEMDKSVSQPLPQWTAFLLTPPFLPSLRIAGQCSRAST